MQKSKGKGTAGVPRSRPQRTRPLGWQMLRLCEFNQRTPAKSWRGGGQRNVGQAAESSGFKGQQGPRAGDRMGGGWEACFYLFSASPGSTPTPQGVCSSTSSPRHHLGAPPSPGATCPQDVLAAPLRSLASFCTGTLPPPDYSLQKTANLAIVNTASSFKKFGPRVEMRSPHPQFPRAGATPRPDSAEEGEGAAGSLRTLRSWCCAPQGATEWYPRLLGIWRPSAVPLDGPRPSRFQLCFRCKAAMKISTRPGAHARVFLQDRSWEADRLAGRGLL